MSFDPNEFNRDGEIRDDEITIITEPELLDDDSIPVAESVELETSYLHPSSLLFTIISQLRQNLIPAIIALF